MAQEYMTEEDSRRARVALLVLNNVKLSLKNVFDLLDGTHVEMPGPEATINSALEQADFYVGESMRRLRKGMGLSENEKGE